MGKRMTRYIASNPISHVLHEVQEEMYRFLNYNDETKEDPFEDEEETESNEMLIDNCVDDGCEETSDNDDTIRDDTE